MLNFGFVTVFVKYLQRKIMNMIVKTIKEDSCHIFYDQDFPYTQGRAEGGLCRNRCGLRIGEATTMITIINILNIILFSPVKFMN